MSNFYQNFLFDQDQSFGYQFGHLHIRSFQLQFEDDFIILFFEGEFETNFDVSSQFSPNIFINQKLIKWLTQQKKQYTDQQKQKVLQINFTFHHQRITIIFCLEITTTQAQVIPPVIQQTLDLVIYLNDEKNKPIDKCLQNMSKLKLGNWDVIHNESVNFNLVAS